MDRFRVESLDVRIRVDIGFCALMAKGTIVGRSALERQLSVLVRNNNTAYANRCSAWSLRRCAILKSSNSESRDGRVTRRDYDLVSSRVEETHRQQY